MRLVERAECSEVEDAAEVDVERVGALAGEDPAPAELVHRLCPERGVVGVLRLPDVDQA